MYTLSVLKKSINEYPDIFYIFLTLLLGSICTVFEFPLLQISFLSLIINFIAYIIVMK